MFPPEKKTKKQKRDDISVQLDEFCSSDGFISSQPGDQQGVRIDASIPPEESELLSEATEGGRKKTTTTTEKRQKWITGARARGDTQPGSGFTGKKTIKSLFEVTVQFLLPLQKIEINK